MTLRGAPFKASQVIPTLDFEYFKNFHGKYYHPSNAKFWFYGDDPATERLALLDKFLTSYSVM